MKKFIWVLEEELAENDINIKVLNRLKTDNRLQKYELMFFYDEEIENQLQKDYPELKYFFDENKNYNFEYFIDNVLCDDIFFKDHKYLEVWGNQVAQSILDCEIEEEFFEAENLEEKAKEILKWGIGLVLAQRMSNLFYEIKESENKGEIDFVWSLVGDELFSGVKDYNINFEYTGKKSE